MHKPNSNFTILRLLTTWKLAILSLPTDMKFSAIGSGIVEVTVDVVVMSTSMPASMPAEVMVLDVMIVVLVMKDRPTEDIFKLQVELAGRHDSARTVWKDNTKGGASSVEDNIIAKGNESERVCEMNVNSKKVG